MALFRVARPMRRKTSSSAYFRRRIPSDVLTMMRGRMLHVPIGEATVPVKVSNTAKEIVVSLRTRDRDEVARREGVVATYLGNVYRAIREKAAPRQLTHEQCVAIAGDFYRAWSELRSLSVVASVEVLKGSGVRVQQQPDLIRPFSEIDGEAEAVYAAEAMAWQRDIERGTAESAIRPLVIRHLEERLGCSVDDLSLTMLLREVVKARTDALRARQKQASGDYSADQLAGRFPSPSVVDHHPQSSPLTITDLFDQWLTTREQRNVAQSTVATYAAVLRTFIAFLQHDDARKVTREDVQRFADERARSIDPRTGKLLSLKTVNDRDLSALKSIFGLAAKRKLLPECPAKGVRIEQGRAPSIRIDKGFSDDEAAAILRAALMYKPVSAREGIKMVAARRWVPWLLAYTGLRVGEVVQLRKQDVRPHEGHPAIFVSFDAGTTKSKSTWPVPLHPHLIELGFLDFVATAETGHLFLTPRPENYDPDAPESRTKDPRGILGPLKGVSNHISEFVRKVVPRASVRPNHGWRHRFKTVGRAHGVSKEVLDAFHDHRSGDESDNYGTFFPAMVEALKKIPRYGVEKVPIAGSMSPLTSREKEFGAE